MTKALWFSYSYNDLNPLEGDEPLSSPYTITYHVARYLRERAVEHGYTFRYVNLDDTTPRDFGADDLVVGHTWWSGGFMHQALAADVRAKIILQPYTAGMVSAGDVDMAKALFAPADHLLLITGRYWFDGLSNSPYAEWRDKATRVDMAVNVANHPYSKTKWGRVNRRAVLAIGADIAAKGLDRVAELARTAGLRLGYFGNASPERFEHAPYFKHHGGVVFTPEVIRQICAEYDFFVTMGDNDANPTTLLETAAWGLIPFCTETSGYYDRYPFPGLTGNLSRDWATMDRWQRATDYELSAESERLREIVARDYNWTRFCETVWGKVREYLD